MPIFSSLLYAHRSRWWLVSLLLVGLGWLRPNVAQATHIRAGEIIAKVDTITGNPNHIYFTLRLYRDPTRIDQPTATFFFGDGTSTGLDAIKKASEVPVSCDTNLLTFYFDHTYGGAGNYTVSFIGENRVAGVVNLFDSVNQTFYVSTTFTIDPGLGRNHSPVLRALAIDKAGVGQVFLHNPAAYDQDGDSLAFRLTESRQVAVGVTGTISPPDGTGTNRPNVTITNGFRYPADPTIPSAGQVALQVPYTGNPSSTGGGAAIFVQDPRTGQITWNAPLVVGVYNIAFVVEEWRRNAFGKRKIGEVTRDMQITVVPTTNIRPTITIPTDICVEANTLVTGLVTAVDGASGSAATPVTLTAAGGPLTPATATSPVATFNQTTKGPPQASATFRWTPDCSNVAKEPYIVVFKAQDTPPGTSPTNCGGVNQPLIDEKPWRITVVGPRPKNLQAVPQPGQKALLTWDKYECQNASQILIFRKEGPSSFVPGPCDTGIPASAGYTQINALSVTANSFVDDNNGAGLVRGRTYCYRIYATFPLPAGGNSIASAEACVTFTGRSAQLTNVDVLSTNATTGQIAIKWTQPRANTGSFNAPLGYRLSRSTTGSAPFTLVTTKTSLADTTYTDTNLNTQDLQYTYQLVFFSATTAQPGSAETTETSPTASSVRTAVVPDGNNNRNTVNWTYNVPWDNTQKPTTVYRRTGTTGTYAPIAQVTSGANSGTYTDQDPTLKRGETYCYYVQTVGQYAGFSYLSNLLNRSQERCAALLAVPCTPVLTLVPTNCDSLAALPSFPAAGQRYSNRLRWTIGNTPAGCSTDAAYYRIFYRSTADGPLTLIDSTTQLTYVHRNLVNAAGCYAVQAVSPAGIRSAQSNVACQDNCVFFLLPNIFTPNGDQYNAVFRPKTASPVTRTHIQIFNRWGRKVYESDKDPYINWDGGGAPGETSPNGKVSDGIYYYLAEVEFADFAGTKRTFKGWVEIVR
jgi:gliding motility-associated-like protein